MRRYIVRVRTGPDVVEERKAWSADLHATVAALFDRWRAAPEERDPRSSGFTFIELREE
jgi:hypothetical protein